MVNDCCGYVSLRPIRASLALSRLCFAAHELNYMMQKL